MQSKELLNLADTIQGEINRMCITDDIGELLNMAIHAENNIQKLSFMRYEDFIKRQEEQPKRLLTLSERNKIITDYEEWCIINNIDGGAESFLDYLCLMEYIHG